jgi:tetratricopeptide (TPR) repeat protein
MNQINIFIICLILFSFILPLVEAKTADEWVTEGIGLGQAGKYAEAIKAYDEALKINPQDAKAWNKEGATLYNLERYDDAIKSYDEALRINPQDAEAWYGKGVALFSLRGNDEGTKHSRISNVVI